MNTKIQVQAGRSSVPLLAVLFGLALFSFNTFAAPPNAPVITALDGQELGLPEQDWRYSLDDAIRGLPFAIDTPTAPQITAQQIVTPSTIGSYINTPGMRLILEPGSYGSITIRGTDKEVVLTTGVIVNELNFEGQRVIARAEPIRTGAISQIRIGDAARDILIDGLYTDGGQHNLLWHFDRVAIINSRFRQREYVLAAFADQAVPRPSNLIIANNYLETYGSTQSAVRLHSINGLAFVDNNIRATGGNGIFRLHVGDSGVAQTANNLYVARNQFEGPGWMITAASGGNEPNNEIETVWVLNNRAYWSGINGWLIQTESTANDWYPRTFTCQNNITYSASGGSYPTVGQHPWTATISNNSVTGYVAPPAWEHQ